MSRRPALSRSEMEIARIVWEKQRATVRDVLDALPEGRDIDYKTVQTFLRRLEAKGYLASRRDGRSLVYTPRVRATQVIKETVQDFVGRLFDGSAFPLVEHLIREQGLSRKDLHQLRGLLDDLDPQETSSSDA